MITEGVKKIANGIKKVTEVVETTMGPKGKNVILDKGIRSPIVTNDGVTVVGEIRLDDEVENTGALMLKEACNKTNFEAGDGTTTTAVLTNAIVQQGLLYLQKGVNPFKLADDMKKIGNQVIDIIKENSLKVDNEQKIFDIAKISSQSEDIAKEITKLYSELDSELVVTIEEDNIIGLSSEIKEGCQFNTGYISPYFITDMQRKECKLNNPMVFVSDLDLKSVNDIMPILNACVQNNRKELIVIANTITGEALSALIVNKMKGLMNVVAVKAPGYGDNKTEFLQDIAILTGGKVILKNTGIKSEDITFDMLGSCRSVVCSSNETTIVEGNGDKELLVDRISLLRKEIESEKSEFAKKQKQERLSKLLGKVGVIRIGEATKMETENKKFKIDDAVNAVRSAIKEGVTIGGGCAYIQAIQLISSFEGGLEKEGISDVAFNIIKNAIEKPFKQIVDNAGYNSEYLIEVEKKEGDFTYGLNIETQKIDDLLEKGVIDSVRVLRVALENAISTAIMVLNSSYVIYYKQKKDEEIH